MIKKRRQVKRWLFNIIGYSFISGATVAFSLIFLTIGIQSKAIGPIIAGIAILGLGIFAGLRGDKIAKSLRNQIDSLTATPLEKQTALREEEKEKDVQEPTPNSESEI